MADVDWGVAVDKQEKAITEKLSEVTVSDDPPGVTEDGDRETSKAEASLLTKILRTKLIENKNDVELMQNDPTSPLYSAKSFEELRLKPTILQGVYGMGFNKPSKIQEKALPCLLTHPPQNLIAQSQSGTGKTAAFVLAMLSRVNPALPYPQVICLSPTFDLAQQTGNVLKKMASFCPEIKVTYALRGNRIQRGTQVQDHIIIGTAGTTSDWLTKLRCFDPKKIVMFVLDEADVMIDLQGQQDQTIRIHKYLPETCQMVLFSATYSEDVMQFAGRLIKNPNILRLKRNEESLDNIRQYYVWCQGDDAKFIALTNLYGVLTIGQCIVFCHTRKTATELAAKMAKEGHAITLITGEAPIEQRVNVLNRFREAKEKLLITTNLCARGIDIEQVTLVVNYDIPVTVDRKPDCETYLHRIGRTGRFGKRGIAINFIDGRRSHENLMAIQEHFGRKIEKLDTDDPDAIEEIQK